MDLSTKIKLKTVIVLMFFVFSCNNEKEVIYDKSLKSDTNILVYNRYEYELSDIYITSDTVDWVGVIGESESTFEYNYFKEISKYQLTYMDVGNFLIKNQDTLALHFGGERLFVINENEFLVYKFLESPLTVDGCVTHFVSPRYGVLIKKSHTWRNYTELNTSFLGCKELMSVLKNENEFYTVCFKVAKELIPPMPEVDEVPE